ncbi:hypothetical protein K461DRAFT_67241 [Myriangium duriaei CBS 260.36]|uniref:PNPLA domain-containing protein n=1 Tax=Myriangium duriaei CBS 260.36 TaxID=1168546 RepID=A0A9P4MCM4_9PEZI|nr:hypothetical protein K461DRAFT_67241 [Myriangium duriaei CBS 260.36]
MYRTMYCSTMALSEVAKLDHSTKAIVRVSDYPSSDELPIYATTRQACLATAATTMLFDPVTVGHRLFTGGEPRANNPVEEVEDQATNIWCADTRDLATRVGCFVSIGTGNPGISGIGSAANDFLRNTLLGLATEMECTEKRFIARWAKHYCTQRYFRFNVHQGLQGLGLDEFNRLGDVEAATHNF